MLTIIVTLTPNYRHVSVLSKFHPATSSYMRTNFSSSILINYEIPMKNVPLKTNVNRTNIFTYALQIILHCYIYTYYTTFRNSESPYSTSTAKYRIN